MREDGFTVFKTASEYYMLLVGAGIALLLSERFVIGACFIAAGLLIRSVTGSKRSAVKSVIQDQSELESFFIDMTTPYLGRHSGWDRIELNSSKLEYHREFCFGGPPKCYETWEYQIKEPNVIVKRLVSSHEDGLYRTTYEVVNNSILENPGDPAKLARLKHSIAWHELHGVVKYAILSQHNVPGSWRQNAFNLKQAFALLERDAAALGAEKSELGDYGPPSGSEEDVKSRIHKLFSDDVLIRKYGVPSYRDWAERDHILKLIDSMITTPIHPPA